MIIAKRLSGCLLGLSLALAAGAAAAAEPLVIFTDQTQIITVARMPGTVVVGNPSIADATIQGDNIFFHGRSFGTTNVIILDDKGKQISSFEITVQLGGSNNVAMFKAGLQYSYVCAPDCEAAMHVGDNPAYFKDNVLERNKDKIQLATGQKSAEADEPPPAQ